MTNKDLLQWITEVQPIAQNGLAYAQNEFDKARYLRLGELAAELAAPNSIHSLEEIKHAFTLEQGYATPKLDVRAFILKEDKLKHDHPQHWPHTYKCFFHCELIAGEPTINIEISAIDFFAIDNLPPLSTARVTEKQLVRLYEQALHAEQTLFD